MFANERLIGHQISEVAIYRKFLMLQAVLFHLINLLEGILNFQKYRRKI